VNKQSFIKFIGTGSGVTSLKRFHSSFLISVPDYNLLVDAGDGVSKALLANKISFNNIDGILLTHLHPDHFSGFASLIVQMKLISRTKNLDVFVNKTLIQTVEDFLYRSYIFYKKLDFKVNYRTYDDDKKTKVAKDYYFIARQNSHLRKYVKFARKKKLSFSCSSVLFKIKDKNFVYSGDVGHKKDLKLFKKYACDLMISEVTHVRLNELISIRDELKLRRLYLTHISEEDEAEFKKLTANQRKYIIPANDGMIIYL